MTARDFVADVARRVFRIDKTFIRTIWRAVREPGTLADDYIAGRRSGIFDPLQALIGSVFVQILAAALTRMLAAALHDRQLLNWIVRLSWFVGFKVLAILWLGLIWRALFRPRYHDLAGMYVFATYSYSVVGLIMALLPLLDVLIPLPLGKDPASVATICLTAEALYLSYGVRQFARLTYLASLLRVLLVLLIGYSALVTVVGITRSIALVSPLNGPLTQ